MKNLFYTFRYLIRTKTNTQIRVISLSLGLFAGLILFSQVAFHMSYDKFYNDADRLYAILSFYTVGDEKDEYGDPTVHAPIATACMENIPEIEYATTTTYYYDETFMSGNKRYKGLVRFADSLFFKTMGIDVIQGNDQLLGVANNVFISENIAKTIFEQEDPIGKSLLFNNNEQYIIQGVFRDIPENASLPTDIVKSFVNILEPDINYWERRDMFKGFVRLHSGVNPESVNEKIPAVIQKYVDVEARKKTGFHIDYLLESISSMHSNHSDVRRICLISTLLGLAILIIACMNYILISISSMASRAKTIGVHKCNGASSGNIFNLFLSETIVITTLSILISFILLFCLRVKIEEIINVSFAGLFTLDSLWIFSLIIVVIFLVAGFLPARIFATIPVTQIFKATTSHKVYWKRALLFIQFSGVTFVILLLIIILFQYQMVTGKELGYQLEGVVYVKIQPTDDQKETEQKFSVAKEEFSRLPYVTSVGTSGYPITSYYGGQPIRDEKGNSLFTTRWCKYDYNYLTTMGIELVEGTNFTAPEQLIVNETFVKRMGWNDSPIGKTVYGDEGSYGTIVGVTKDYVICNLYMEHPPVMIQGERVVTGELTLRITDLSAEQLQELNQKLTKLYPDQFTEFTILQEEIHTIYTQTRQFRDSVIAASIIVLLITGMGLIGYITDEVTRRSKEIAIRKVNGATAGKILELLYKDISYLSLPAIIIGAMIAFIIGREWLQEFAVKITLNPLLFIGSGVVIACLIMGVVTIQAWQVANENPVESIKAE